MALDKLSWLAMATRPKTFEAELDRFYIAVQSAFKKMSGEFSSADRVITAGDFSAQFIESETPRWVDYNVGAASLGTAASAPDLIQLNGSNIYLPAFDGTATSEQLFGSIEINHDYKEGTDLLFHVHWLPTTSSAGNVKWNLDYVIQNLNTPISAATTVSVTTAASGTAWRSASSEFPAIFGKDIKVGAQFIFRLYRTPADVADTYADDVAAATVGLHVQVDSLGSRQKLAK